MRQAIIVMTAVICMIQLDKRNTILKGKLSFPLGANSTILIEISKLNQHVDVLDCSSSTSRNINLPHRLIGYAHRQQELLYR